MLYFVVVVVGCVGSSSSSSEYASGIIRAKQAI